MKVFGVGWPKTGTTTLQQCFGILGFSFYGYRPSLVGRPEVALAIARRFDSFKDWPWSLYYKELDEKFPGSKFVLTMRESESWLRSYRNWVSRHGPTHRPSPVMDEARRIIYGTPTPTEEQAVARFERHNAEVQEHFADRPEYLLVVDWKKGDGWVELCQFLDRPIAERPFPHANKSVYN